MDEGESQEVRYRQLGQSGISGDSRPPDLYYLPLSAQLDLPP